MSDVSSVSASTHAHHAHEARSREAIARDPVSQPATSSRAADLVELSSASIARISQQADEPVRLGLVQQIRDELRAGTYETESKVTLASDALARALSDA